ncbi:hypothetical protein [Sinomicrobium sp. M5D2P9]
MKKIYQTFIPGILLSLVSLHVYPQYEQYSISTESSEGNLGCYCFYYDDYNRFMDALAALAAAEREAWLREREGILKEEMENRLNKQFGSFREAQKEYFKHFEGIQRSLSYISDYRSSISTSKKRHEIRMDEEYRVYKIFDLRGEDLLRFSNGQLILYDFGDLEYNGIRIEDTPYHDVRALSSVNYEHYEGWARLYESEWARLIKLDKVLDDEQLAYYIADRYINHYEDHNLEDKITLMAKYLIWHYGGAQGPVIETEPDFYQNGDYMPVLKDMVSDTDLSSYPIAEEPDISMLELKREFALDRMDTGVADFIRSHENLRILMGEYWDTHEFDRASLDFVEDFFWKYLNNGLFLPDWEAYRTNTVSIQNEDRPEQVFRAFYSGSRPIYGFSKILKFFSGIGERDNFEGQIIRDLTTANKYTIPASITSEELGKVFDFDYTGNTLKIVFSADARERIINLRHGDYEYGWDLFTDPFKIKLLKELAKGNVVDFRDTALMEEFFEVREEIPTAKFERYRELNELIKYNPWVLIQDCAQQNGLDIANYQDLYNHTIPKVCEDRLNVLGSGFKNQPIKEGNAAAANIDYYSVEITSLPDFNNDGSPDLEEGIFQEFRKSFLELVSGEKNDFKFSCDIPGSSTDIGHIKWEFLPYFQSDVDLWNSTQNPLTTIIGIDAGSNNVLLNLTSDLGAIMISKYTSNYWIGSTVVTPESGSQPFSGNRQWGWLINQNGNIEFYTRAVDVAKVSKMIRVLSLGSDPCQEDTYYNVAEATWLNLQKEVKQWILDNGGQAKIIPKTAIRVDKDKLKDLLENNETIDQIPCN